MQETEKIWMNGELVDWADAKIHVGVHGLHYGSGVFEGIRCYDTAKGPAVFRLREHLERLESSARILFMEMPYSVDELREATHELLATNGLSSCYIRPIAFYGYSELGVAATDNPIDVVIMSLPMGRVSRRGRPAGGHHDDDLELGACRARTSSRTPRRRRASISTRCSRRRRRAERATTRRSCSRTTATSRTDRGRRSSS